MKTLDKKKKFFFLALLFIGVGVFLVGSPAFAGWAEKVVGGIIGIIISALGIIMVLVIKALVAVAQYNDFINAPAISNGWSIVRDVCNMFFIVVLLIIAFATILNQEKYSYKTWLPKLILMAVLINFSKTICGVIIDVAQVVMMTFVNAFKGMAAGNLVDNLGITDVVTLANNSADLGFWAIVGAYVLGLFYMIIALVVVVTMVAMLVMRMVMIWVYVVLSPAAYVLGAFPGGQKYSSMWWSEFVKNVIVGPVLAFFIWLSFVSLQSFDYSQFDTGGNMSAQQAGQELLINPSNTDSNSGNSTAVTKAGELDVFLKFIIAIGMLIGGLKIASEIGGAAGKIAGTGMSKLQQGATFAGKTAGRAAWKGAVGAERWGARKLAKITTVDWRYGTLKAGWKAHSEAAKRNDETQIADKSAEHFNAGGIRSVVFGAGAGKNYFDRYADGFMGMKGIGRAGKEIFYSPSKRRSLGNKIDQQNENLDNLKEARAQKEEEKKKTEEAHKTANQVGIDKEFYSLAEADVDLNNLIAKKSTNSGKITKLESIKKAGNLTFKQEDELVALEQDNQKIDSDIESKKALLKNEASLRYHEGLNVAAGGGSFGAFSASFTAAEVSRIDKEFADELKKLDPNGAMADLENRSLAGEQLNKEEKTSLNTFKADRKNLEEKRTTSIDGINDRAKNKYIATVVGVDDIDKQISDLDVRMKVDKDSLKQLKKDILKVQKPTSLEGRSIYRQAIEEAKAKHKSITNSDELGKAYVDAAQRGDKFDQIAIAEKMSSDGNLNDLLNLRGYSSDATGLYQFVHGLDNGKGGGEGLKGFSDHERLQILNDLGESEEKVNHWEMAKMVGMNDKGEMESFVKAIKNATGKIVGYDTTRHTAAAFNEVQKMDPQQSVIRLNRLAYGGEDEEGNFKLADLGKLIFKSLAEGGAYSKNEGRIQANAAANLMSPQVIPVLQRILSANEKLANTVFTSLTIRGGKEGGGKTGNMMNWLEEFNKKNT